jgi:acetyltransferase-like isoleucine patch superfamily enzyme
MGKMKVPGVTIYEYAKISGIRNIKFGRNIIIDSFAFIYANKRMVIGNNVHIASFVFIGGGEEVEIGDFVGIFQGSKIYASSDDFKDWGFGNPTIPEKYRNPKRLPVNIGRFAVIGANAVVLPGVTIGEGATVGACSVVTKDLEPWGIYIGNKKVGERKKNELMLNYEQYLKETGLK